MAGLSSYATFEGKNAPARDATALAPYFKEKGVIFKEKNAPRGC